MLQEVLSLQELGLVVVLFDETAGCRQNSKPKLERLHDDIARWAAIYQQTGLPG